MQTECPHCHTIFRITEAQFDMAEGRVQCGYCKQVFDASIEDSFKQNRDQLDVFQDSPVASPFTSSEEALEETEDETLFAGEQHRP